MSDSREEPESIRDAPPEKWPVGFILLLVAGALYLLLRFVQMAGWLLDWAT
jgi:hypothetical protein